MESVNSIKYYLLWKVFYCLNLKLLQKNLYAKNLYRENLDKSVWKEIIISNMKELQLRNNNEEIIGNLNLNSFRKKLQQLKKTAEVF